MNTNLKTKPKIKRFLHFNFILVMLIDLIYRFSFSNADLFELSASIILYSIPVLILLLNPILRRMGFDDKGYLAISTFLLFSFPLYSRYLLERRQSLSLHIIILGIVMGGVAAAIFSSMFVFVTRGKDKEQ